MRGLIDDGSNDHSTSRASTNANTSDGVSPGNARRPVSISNRTQPNAKMSLRRSALCPRACSGAMYAAVPRSTPTPVIIAGEVIVGDIETDAAPGSP